MEKFDQWKQRMQARKKAEAWEDLPNGPRYQKDKDFFRVSLAHCKSPLLTRTGQQGLGGKNYWETEDEFNQAILEYTVKNWEDIYPEVLALMKDKEKKALQDCQQLVDEMQDAINATKE